MEWDKVQLLALTMMPKVGPVVAKQLIYGCGSIEAVFTEKPKNLLRIPGVGPAVVREIQPSGYLLRAEREVRWAEKRGITILAYTDETFPLRLQHIESSPLVLFYMGNANLNHLRTVAMIGTRAPSSYGKIMCSTIVEGLAAYQPLVVSGLAYGIDAVAHKTCVDLRIPTLAVLGHGLDRLYPAAHRPLAEAILMNGGLLTEFVSGTLPDRENFPMRNRIIAGLSDAVVVVESGKTGGSMITAEFANDFNKDVFAVPGQVDLPHSEGSHHLIKHHKAHLIESASDVAALLRWDDLQAARPVQTQLCLDLTADEQKAIAALQQHKERHIDALTCECGVRPGEMAALLLGLECKGVVRALPGRKFSLV